MGRGELNNYAANHIKFEEGIKIMMQGCKL